MARPKSKNTAQDIYDNLTLGEKKLLAQIAKYPQFCDDVSPIIASRLSQQRLIEMREECIQETGEIFCVDVWHITTTVMTHEVAKIALARQHKFDANDFYKGYVKDMEDLKAPLEKL